MGVRNDHGSKRDSKKCGKQVNEGSRNLGVGCIISLHEEITKYHSYGEGNKRWMLYEQWEQIMYQ